MHLRMETVRTEFFILEETKINGSAYILVAESEDDDAECLILKDVRDEESGRERL